MKNETITIRVFNIVFDEPVYYNGKPVTEETYEFTKFDQDGDLDEDYELLMDEGVEDYFTTLFNEDFGVDVKSFDFQYLSNPNIIYTFTS